MTLFLRLLSSLVLAAMLFLSLAAPAHAQSSNEAAAPVEATPAATDGEADSRSKEATATWERQFAHARLLMRDGFFTAAAAAFSSLAESATNTTRKRAALEASWLAAYWARNGYSLQLRPPTSPATKAMVDRRSTDEAALLYTTAFFYGLGSGISLGVITQPDSAAVAILPTLALVGLAGIAVYQYDTEVGLRYGAAQSITSGFYIGLEEGLAWILWYQSKSTWEEELSEKAVASVLWASATVGVLTGGWIGQRYGTTPGRASLMGSGAIWSAVVAGLTAHTLTGDGDGALLTAAIALNVGAIAAVPLGRQVQPSLARVRFLDLGGLAGGLLGGGLYLTVAENTSSTDGRGFSTSLAVGFGAGLLSAWYLTRDMQPDERRSGRGELLSLVPTLAPSADGRGGLVGVGGAF